MSSSDKLIYISASRVVSEDPTNKKLVTNYKLLIIFTYVGFLHILPVCNNYLTTDFGEALRTLSSITIIKKLYHKLPELLLPVYKKKMSLYPL